MFGTSLILINKVYRLEEKNNTMEGPFLSEMSNVTSIN